VYISMYLLLYDKNLPISETKLLIHSKKTTVLRKLEFHSEHAFAIMVVEVKHQLKVFEVSMLVIFSHPS